MLVETIYWKVINFGNKIISKVTKHDHVKVIYVEPRAGLCNRMRVIASAFKLAEKYGAQLVVMWRLTKGLNCSFSNLFCLDERIKIIESRHKIDFRFMWKAMKADICLLNCRYEEKDNIERAVEKGGYVYITSVHNFYNAEDFSLFRPVESIEKQVLQITERIDKNTIGIHIRRTDAVKSIQYSPTQLFFDYIGLCIEKDKKAKFYLATDSEDVEKELLASFPGGVFVVNELKRFGRDSQKGMEDAVIDLFCLSKCSYIVGSYWSSFSEIAAAIGNIKLNVLTNWNL